MDLDGAGDGVTVLEGSRRTQSATIPRLCARRVDVDGVDRAAGGHEQAVAGGATEAQVRARLRQDDLSVSGAGRREAGHGAVTAPPPPGGGPQVPGGVAADTVRAAGTHLHEAPPGTNPPPDDIVDMDAPRLGPWVPDIEAGTGGGEEEP